MTGYDCFADDYQNYVSSFKQKSVPEVDAIDAGTTGEVVVPGGCGGNVVRRSGLEVAGGCGNIAYAPLDWWQEQA